LLRKGLPPEFRTAKSTPAPYVYRAEVISVYDGDTVTAMVDLGMSLQKKCSCRLYGIDTPEKYGKRAGEKAAAKKALERVEELILGKWVTLHSVAEPDKYGRLLTDIWIDDVHVNQLLIDEGLALPYDGGTKPTWVFDVEG